MGPGAITSTVLKSQNPVESVNTDHAYPPGGILIVRLSYNGEAETVPVVRINTDNTAGKSKEMYYVPGMRIRKPMWRARSPGARYRTASIVISSPGDTHAPPHTGNTESSGE